MDVLAVVVLFQFCWLQSYEAMPAKSRDDWTPNTRSGSPPDIPLPNNGLLLSGNRLPSNGNRNWFFYHSNGGSATAGNIGKTGTGSELQWRQTGTHMNGHFVNQSMQKRPSGIFRTFYFSSNNTDGNNITNDFMNRGGMNGFNSGHNINPNISMGGNSSFFFSSGVMNYTGSGNDMGNILEVLKKNNSFGQMQTFQSQMNPSNFTNPDFFQSIRERIQNPLGKNTMHNSSTINYMSSGPLAWESSGHNQIPDRFNGANVSSNFVMFSNGTRIFNSYQNGFNYSKIQELRVDPSTTISPLNDVPNIPFDSEERNFSLNSLFELSRNSKFRQLNENQDSGIQFNSLVGNAEQHSPSQKDIDRVFNSFQLPEFNRKNLKGSSSDILRDLKEVVKFWMKEREKDISGPSATTIPPHKETTSKDNVSETKHVDNNSTITFKTSKPIPESNEEILVTNANLNESKTSVQPLTESDERITKTTDNYKRGQSKRTEFKEDHETNEKHIGKTIKPKIQTSILKTTVKPESSSTQTSPTRPLNINQRDKSMVKQGESTDVGGANQLAKTMEHSNDLVPAVPPPIFEIPAETVVESTNNGILTAQEEFRANVAAKTEEKSTIRSPSNGKEILPKIPKTEEKSTVPGSSNLGEIKPNIRVTNSDNSTDSRRANQGEFQPNLPMTNKDKSTVPRASKPGKFQPELQETNKEKSTVLRSSKDGEIKTNELVTNKDKPRVGVSSEFSNISSNASTKHKDSSVRIPNTDIQQIFKQDGLSTPSFKSTLPPIFAHKADTTVKDREPNESIKSKRTYSRELLKSSNLSLEEAIPVNAIGKTKTTYSMTSSITTTTVQSVSSQISREPQRTSNKRIKWLQYPSINTSTTSKSSRPPEIGKRMMKTTQDDIRYKTPNERITQPPEVDTKPIRKIMKAKLKIDEMSENMTTTERPSEYISNSPPSSIPKDKKADANTNNQINVKGEPSETFKPMTDSYNTLPTVLPPIFIPPSAPKTGIRPSFDSEAFSTNMMSREYLQSKPRYFQPSGEVTIVDSPSKFPTDIHEVPTENKEKVVQISRKNTSKIITETHSINQIEDKTVPEIATKKDNQSKHKKPLYPPNHSSQETPDIMPPIFLPPIVVPKSTITNSNSDPSGRINGVHTIATNLTPGKSKLGGTLASFGSETNLTTGTIKNALKIPNDKQMQTLQTLNDSVGSVFSSTTLPSIFSKASPSSRSAKIEKSEISSMAMNNKFRNPDYVHVGATGDTNIGFTKKAVIKGVSDEGSLSKRQREAATRDATRNGEISAQNTFHKTLGSSGTQGLHQQESEEYNELPDIQHIPNVENQQHKSTGKYIQEIMKPSPIKSKYHKQVGGVTVASKIDAIMNLLYQGLSSTVTALGRIPETTSRIANQYSTLPERSPSVTSLAPVVIAMDHYDRDGIDRSTVSDDKLYNGRKGDTRNVLKYTTAYKSLNEKIVRTDVPYVSSPMSFPDTPRKVPTGKRAAGLRSHVTKASVTTEPSVFKSENILSGNTDTKPKKNIQNDKLHKITIPILELYLSGRPDFEKVQEESKPLENSLVESTTDNAFNRNAQKYHNNGVFGIDAFQDTTKESVAEVSKMSLPSHTKQRISRNVKTGINILNALFPTSPVALTTYRATTDLPFGLKTNGLSKIFTPRLRY